MVDAFLIITVIVMALLLVGVMCVMLIIFGHPDDKSVAKFPKVITVMGLWLAFASILVLPLDVANAKEGDGRSLRVDLVWEISFIWMALMITFIIPFAFFFYESDVEEGSAKNCCQTQTGQAFMYTVGFFVVFTAILVSLFAAINEAIIPVTQYRQSSVLWVAAADPVPNTVRGCFGSAGRAGIVGGCQKREFDWELPVTFPVYLIAFLSFVGWFFFSLFVAVGLVAMPMDLINEYRTRPTPINTRTYEEEKMNLGKRAALLIEIGQKVQHAQESHSKHTYLEKRKTKKDLHQFEKHYYFLKKDYQILETAHKLKGGNPLWYLAKLCGGILSGALSITWIIHMALFMLSDKPSSAFLNDLFINLEFDSFPLFGVIAFAIFAFYLLWCVVKGNFKLGVRLLFWKIYPMELHNTLMNAFLVNTWLILLCSVPAVQFCAEAFPEYAQQTDVDLIFGTQIRYLKFFTYFFSNNIFLYVILAVAGLTLVWLVIQPRDKSQEVEAELDKLANEKDGLGASL